MTGVLDADDPRCIDPSEAGGKGASLARLSRHGAPVPQFFVVPASAYRTAAGGSVDPALKAEVEAALARKFGPDTRFAVRSSAVGEDGAEDSFAGIFETVLDVRGVDAVVESIEVCWSSFGAARADSYRQERDVVDQGGMAVVVQELVDHGWAGVCFTADPAALALSRGVIEGTKGAGEEIVSGEVTGARAVVDARTGGLVEERADESGRVLPPGVVDAVWAESARLAKAFGFPQDVEWSASAAGELSVLQSRPVTTIGLVVAERPLESWPADLAEVDDPARLWTRTLSDEVWSPPVSPLFYTLHDMSGYFRGHHELHGVPERFPDAVQKYHAAAVYFETEVLARTYSYLPRLARIPAILNFFPERDRDAVAQAPWRWTGWLRRTWSFEVARRGTHSLKQSAAALDRALLNLQSQADRWADEPVESMGEEELFSHLRQVWTDSKAVFELSNITVMFHAFDLRLLLIGLLDRWVGDGDRAYAAVSVGLEGVSTVAEAGELWSLAAMIRSDPEHARTLERVDSFGELLEALDGSALGGALADFARAHRHRGANYKDLIYPRWGDDPDALLGVVRSFVGSSAAAPLTENRARAAERREAKRRILARLGGPFAPVRRALLGRLMGLNERYQRQRDDYRFQLDLAWYEARRAYLALGERLLERGLLRSAQDAFFLGRRELRDASKGRLPREAIEARVEPRRAAWEQTRDELPPRFLRGYVPVPDEPTAFISERTLSGVAASPGFAVGPARIIADVAELVGVQDGDVLVTRRTDPGWTSAFPRLAGVVLETGSSLSHAASLCREFSLPCVTAVDGATTLIAEGGMVEVLGSEGLVRLLSDEEARR